MCSVPSPAMLPSSWPTGRWPGEIAAVPTLITELGLTGVLFTADALHYQKDAFTRAAETGNALLVQVKQNQPTLHDRLGGGCAHHSPSTAKRRWTGGVMAARSIDWLRCSTPPVSWIPSGSR